MTEVHIDIYRGEQSGRDPREMTITELNSLGHRKMSLMKAIVEVVEAREEKQNG